MSEHRNDVGGGLDVGRFLGCGFRIELPAHPAAVHHAQAQVTALARLLGAESALDPSEFVPSRRVLRADSAWLWVGGWAYEPGGGFGPLESVTEPRDLDLEVRPGVAVDVPYPVSSMSPTCGLPTLAVPAYELGGGRVGLLRNERGEVCGSTAGNLLVRDGGRWLHAEPASGVIPTWLHDDVAVGLDARPGALTTARLDAADDVVALSALGGITVLHGSADDVVSAREAALR